MNLNDVHKKLFVSLIPKRDPYVKINILNWENLFIELRSFKTKNIQFAVKITSNTFSVSDWDENGHIDISDCEVETILEQPDKV